MNLETIRKDLAALRNEEVVLYGSVVTGMATSRSDVDVAVLTHGPDPATNRVRWRAWLGTAPDRYDIRVYELLPLPMQIDIADHHQVVFGDPTEISWYFYGFRRRWKDQRRRFEENRFRSTGEKREALRRAERPTRP